MPRMLPEKMLFPQEMKDYYMQDMPRVPEQTLLTMYRTYMHYHLKDSLRNTKAQVMYWYGQKEMKCVKDQRNFSNYMCRILPYMRQKAITTGILPSISQRMDEDCQQVFDE